MQQACERLRVFPTRVYRELLAPCNNIIESLLDCQRHALAPRLRATAAVDCLNITKSLVGPAAIDASCDTVTLTRRGCALMGYLHYVDEQQVQRVADAEFVAGVFSATPPP